MDNPLLVTPPPPFVSKTFSLTPEDATALQRVRDEEGIMSDSAALRVLIRDGLKFRELRRQAEQQLMSGLIKDVNV